MNLQNNHVFPARDPQSVCAWMESRKSMAATDRPANHPPAEQSSIWLAIAGVHEYDRQNSE
jgi:hypothetical protein